VLAVALADDGEDGDAARVRLARDPELHAPHLVDLEVMSALRRQAGAGMLDARRAGLALQDLVSLPVTRYPHVPFAPRVWELRGNLTPYDAAYVALAESLGCTLVTADARMARAPGIRCAVEVLRAAAPGSG
jgi:predicted nucleic acid-binding protein